MNIPIKPGGRVVLERCGEILFQRIAAFDPFETLVPIARRASAWVHADGAFGRVSGERLKREIDKLFEDARLGLDPAAALGLLSEWHVLGALEPGLSLPRRATAPRNATREITRRATRIDRGRIRAGARCAELG